MRLNNLLLPLFGCGLVVANSASAQAIDTRQVDSAAVARSAWTAANRALRAGDVQTASREMHHAASAWPSQVAYLWGATAASALNHDTSGVLRGLRSIADLGLGRQLRSDTILAPYLQIGEIRAAANSVEANVAPYVRSAVVGQLPDSTFYPEGVDYDPRSKSYYVASIRHRTIAELRAGGSSRLLWAPDRDDIGAVMGVRADTTRHLLWATTSAAAQMERGTGKEPGLASLLRIDPEQGTIEQRWTIPDIGHTHALGDLAIGPTGDVFLTDSEDPVLYRLRNGADTLEPLRSPLFRSLQGLAPTADGRYLFVADYSLGLLRVDIASSAVLRLADAPHSTSLGCDGILLAPDGSLIAVQNGVAPARVMRFTVNRERTAILSAQVIDRNPELADEPTIATFARGMIVYVANSQWEKYDDAGTRRRRIPLAPPVLLGIPFDLSPVR